MTILKQFSALVRDNQYRIGFFIPFFTVLLVGIFWQPAARKADHATILIEPATQNATLSIASGTPNDFAVTNTPSLASDVSELIDSQLQLVTHISQIDSSFADTLAIGSNSIVCPVHGSRDDDEVTLVSRTLERPTLTPRSFSERCRCSCESAGPNALPSPPALPGLPKNSAPADSEIEEEDAAPVKPLERAKSKSAESVPKRYEARRVPMPDPDAEKLESELKRVPLKPTKQKSKTIPRDQYFQPVAAYSGELKYLREKSESEIRSRTAASKAKFRELATLNKQLEAARKRGGSRSRRVVPRRKVINLAQYKAMIAAKIGINSLVQPFRSSSSPAPYSMKHVGRNLGLGGGNLEGTGYSARSPFEALRMTSYSRLGLPVIYRGVARGRDGYYAYQIYGN